MAAKKAKPFEIAGACVLPGRRARLDLQVARLPAGNWITIPLEVFHGRKPGPVVFLCAAIHGDELNGIPVIRRIIRQLKTAKIAGTVIAVPIVNVFGVMTDSRYLPDRRDLNRSFPGSPRGSMASRLANLFMKEVVAHADFGVDLHTGSNRRENLPQVRGNLDDPAIRKMAEAFAAPVMFNARERSGSLRYVAGEQGCPVLLYEAGEASRFSHSAIDVGVGGVLRVLHSVGVLDEFRQIGAAPGASREIGKSEWARATRSGYLDVKVEPGAEVEEGSVIATVSDAFGDERRRVTTRVGGVVLGVSRAATVHRGEALVHVGVPVA